MTAEVDIDPSGGSIGLIIALCVVAVVILAIIIIIICWRMKKQQKQIDAMTKEVQMIPAPEDNVVYGAPIDGKPTAGGLYQN